MAVAPLACTMVLTEAAAEAPAPVLQPPQPGEVIAGRRVPTKEEIARVNAQLRATPAPAEDDGPMTTAGGDRR